MVGVKLAAEVSKGADAPNSLSTVVYSKLIKCHLDDMKLSTLHHQFIKLKRKVLFKKKIVQNVLSQDIIAHFQKLCDKI